MQGGETDLITSVLIGTLLVCEVNSYLFFCLKTRVTVKFNLVINNKLMKIELC